MLRREGWPVNKKRVYRWYETELQNSAHLVSSRDFGFREPGPAGLATGR